MSGNSGIEGDSFAYNSQLDAFTLYHLIQEGTSSKDYGGPALPALGHALAGAVASALSKTVVYPIDTIVTRMQVQKSMKGEKETEHAASDASAEYRGPIDAARKIHKSEGGIGAFYTGLSTDVVKQIADSFLFFLAYSAVRERMLKSQGGRQLTIPKELSVGVLAGAFAKAITSPIQNILTRQQTAALVAARNPSSSATPGQMDKLSVREIITQIRREKGIAGFWSGYSAQLILTLNPAITFAVDNMLQGLIPRKYRDNPTPASTFLVAALSKVVATSITYPVMLAKSRAQASLGSDSDGDADPSYRKVETSTTSRGPVRQMTRQLSKLVESQAALLRSLQRIYRHEGIAGLYCGLEGEVVKGFLQHGTTMMVKDSVHGGIIQLYFVLLKMTKKWPADLEQARQSAGAVAKDAQQRAENVGVTVAEGAKALGKNLTGQE